MIRSNNHFFPFHGFIPLVLSLRTLCQVLESPILFSQMFLVLWFTLSLYSFWVNFLCKVWELGQSSFLPPHGGPTAPKPFFEDDLSFTELVLPKISWASLCGSAAGFSISHCSILDYNSYTVSLEIRSTDSILLIFLLQNYFVILAPFLFHINFKIIMSIFTQNITDILRGIILNIYINLEEVTS